jgi:GT2 family glycosyltransferase
MTARDPSLGDLDVIVVTWNSAPHLGATLTALPPWARVVVVDNASADSSVHLARSMSAEVIEMGRNTGFPSAVNAGLATVTAPAVLLLNPDIVVAPGTVERCLTALRDDPTIGIVGPATTTATGLPEPAAARHDRRAWHILVESLGLVHLSRRLDRQMVHDRDHDQDVDAVHGAFMLVRTDLLRSLGGLDETVFMYLEDADLCRRVRDAGFRVRFVADAPAIHEGGASTAQGASDAQVRAYLHRIDADVEFVRRYGYPGEAVRAIGAFVLRSVVGLAVAVVRPARRARYRAALRYSLRQLRGRQAPADV